MKPTQQIFYVGSQQEAGHHARPLQAHLNVEVAPPDDVLQRAKPGDLAIFFSEHFDRFRECCRQLKQRGCATLYAIDGILEWRNSWDNHADEPACPWTMRPVLAHKVACIGPAQRRILDAWGNEKKTEIVGLTRLDEIARQRFSWPEGAMTVDHSCSPPGRTEDEQWRVLVATAKCPGFTPEQLGHVRQALAELKTWFDQHPVINARRVVPVWRLTAGLDHELGVKNKLADLSGVEMQKLLSQVDALVTTPSTTMLEGMLAGLPVALFEFNLCPIYVPAAWHMHAAHQIDPVLRELQSKPPAKMLWQEMLLRDQLAMSGKTHNDADAPDSLPQTRCHESATDRMCALIQQMLEIADQQTASQRPLTFPARMLSDGHLESNLPEESFSLSQLYASHDSFKKSDIIELQSELAHARREIEHRQRLLNQAKSELAQAHEILFSIEKHPLAGPVVRARKRILNFIAQYKRSSAKPSGPATGE
jgi:hypothetical protein